MQVDVGIVDDIQYGNPKSPRFVYWDKKLRPTPSGPDVLTFDLLSIGGKLRAGMGLLGLRPKMPGQHCMHVCSIHWGPTDEALFMEPRQNNTQ